MTAKPGDRFTDSDGGTWVLTRSTARDPWEEITREGERYRRSQEEAEKAGLIELATPARALGLRERAFEAGVDWANQGNRLAAVPLDPSDPDDLRRGATFLVALANRPDDDRADSVPFTASSLRAIADRLDRERAEQARDEADREWAHELWMQWNHEGGDSTDLALRAIRAERARASAEDAS